MNFKYVAMATALPLLIMVSIAQAQTTSINTGDNLPDQAKSYIAKSVPASKGKAIILDFWATWCASCITKLPSLDSLQKAYKHDVEIILVNAANTLDNDKKISSFFKQYQKTHKNEIELSAINNDQLLDQLFKHKLIPHEIWIDKNGGVKAITSASHVNAENIQKLISGETLNLPEKKDALADTVPKTASVEIKGVTRLSGERTTLPNALIGLTHSGSKTLTNQQGQFRIKSYYADDSIIIAHTGYETVRLSISEISQPLEVDLTPQARILENVTVSTGYQQVPKERATGSFALTDRAVFNQQVSTDVLSRLEAVSSGVSVYRKQNSNGQVMVRGLSTITGPKSPLIIVDNFPYEGDINNINPNEVENITILKDAAAASIWGARAGNGVIVITTRKSKYNQAMQAEFSASVSSAKEPNLFNQPSIASSDMVDLEQFLYSKGYNLSDTANTARPIISPVYEILLKQKRGLLSSSQVQGMLDSLKRYDVRNDYLKYFYQPSLNQQYHLSLKGGSENLAWLFSGGVDKNLSNVSAKYQRVNVRSYSSYKISSKLNVSANIYYTESRTASGKPAYGSVSTAKGKIEPYTRFADDNGNAFAVYTRYRQAYIDTAGGGKLADWKYYPLTDWQHSSASSVSRDVTADVSLNYKISKALSADFKYEYENQFADSRTLNDEQSFFSRDLINTFSQVNFSTGTVTYRIPKGSILDYKAETILSSKGRAQLNFSRSWKKHSVDAIAGGEISNVAFFSASNRAYGYNDDNLLSIPVDKSNTYPTYIRGSQALIPDNTNFQGKLTRFVSFFTNASYTYLNKYTLSFSARRDASNNFGVATNDRWTPLWSAGAGWDLLKEKFFTSSLFSRLRLRLTYGYSGNIDPSLSALTTVAYLNTNVYTQSPTAYVDKFYNPDLRWEKSGQFNSGIDFTLAGARLSGSIEYYLKHGKDLYGKSPLDYSAGLSVGTITKNVASMKGRGADVVVNSLNLKGAVEWTTNLNLSYYHDEVTSYYLTNQQGSNFINGGSVISGISGKPVYSVFAYPWAGLDPQTGDPRGYLKGQPSNDYTQLTGATTTINDLSYMGPAMPRWYGSMGNTITWKSFSITARIMYQFGSYYMRESINYTSLLAGNNGHTDYALRWQKPGDEINTYVPSLIYPLNSLRDAFYRGSEGLAGKADHIRLQYVTLNYTLKPRSTSLYRRLDLFVNASNLGILWKATKYDVDPAYPNGVIPPSKAIAAGVKMIF